MQLLPWNNPIVGTAFMLRARRGNILTSLSLYIIVLVMAMVGWQYYLSFNQHLKLNPAQSFLRFLFGAQCFFSGIVMMGQAGGAIKNEVMNKTLDFQRIASTSPWDILLGKLLGAPVMAYLLAMAAIPIAVFTLLDGVTGISIVDLFLMWVQMMTFLFLLGTCVIQNTLQATSTKGTGGSPIFGFFIGVMGIIIYASYSTSDPRTYLSDPIRMSLGALFSPLTAYAAIAVNDSTGLPVNMPWGARFYWFSLQIPCLLFTPIAHLVIGWFFLSIMARRLANPDVTPLGKTRSYLMLALVDLVLVGVLNSCSRTIPVLGAAGIPLQLQVGLFLIIHGLISVAFFIALTPRVDLVMSWIWRFRSKNDVTDSLLQDRAPNTMSVVMNLLIAAVGVLTLVCFNPEDFEDVRFLPEASLSIAVLVLFLGLFFQALQLKSRKFGSVYFILFVFTFCITPLIAGGIMRSAPIGEYKTIGNWLLHSTPLTMVLQWVMPSTDKQLFDVNPYPMAGVYLLLSLLTLFYTWRWVSQRTIQVETIKTRLLAKDQEKATEIKEEQNSHA